MNLDSPNQKVRLCDFSGLVTILLNNFQGGPAVLFLYSLMESYLSFFKKKQKKTELDLQNTDYEDTYQPMNTYANTNQMSTAILTYFSFYIEIKRERQREKTLVDDKIERSNRICNN